MEVIEFGKELNSKITLCLGQFDSFHNGHRELVKRAKNFACNDGSELAIFTFSNDISSQLKGGKGLVYTFDERLSIFRDFGIKTVIYAKATDEFLSETANIFIEKLKKYDISNIIVGEDYTFGKNKSGTALLLKDEFQSKGVQVEIIPFVECDNQKISTTRIKEYLSCGEIKKANEMLGDKYFLIGEVIHGRKVGRTLGFPTLNVAIKEEKFRLSRGVYKTQTVIDGKDYSSLTNYGNAETFGENNVLTETHVLGFNGDIYGKTVKIKFIEFLREIVKFKDIDGLKLQLQKDTEKCK